MTPARTNWRTTAMGIGSLVGGVAMLLMVVSQALRAAVDGDPETTIAADLPEQIELAVAGIVAALAGLGLIQARDAVVSTEETRGEK